MTIMDAARKAADEKQCMFRASGFHNNCGIVLVPNAESESPIDVFEYKDGKIIFYSSRRKWFDPTAEDILADDWQVGSIGPIQIYG